RYVQANSVEEFLSSTEIDVVSRRLTVSLTREGLGLLFGPVTFYDGQGFLVSKALRANTAADLAGTPICVDAGTLFESNVTTYFATKSLSLNKQLMQSHDQIPRALA